MFYKNNVETGEWFVANEVHFPNGSKLTREFNRIVKDGWVWHDEEPIEYKNWKEAQTNEQDGL